MYRLKVEFLLPLKDNKGNEIDVDKYDITYQELEDRFYGYTVDNSPLLGDWKDVDTGLVYIDDNFGVWVLCDDTKEIKDFWINYKEKLKERFEQIEILMYHTKIFRY